MKNVSETVSIIYMVNGNVYVEVIDFVRCNLFCIFYMMILNMFGVWYYIFFAFTLNRYNCFIYSIDLLDFYKVIDPYIHRFLKLSVKIFIIFRDNVYMEVSLLLS